MASLQAEGMVTALLANVVDSSQLWEREPAAMRQALAMYDQIFADVVEAHRGRRSGGRGEGEGVLALFRSPKDAAAAAIALQHQLAATAWPEGARLRGRVALHAGLAEAGTPDHYGPIVNRGALLRAAAGSGEILLSQEVADALQRDLPDGAQLRDIGLHRLQDLGRPVQLFRLEHPLLPLGQSALNTLDAAQTNLPEQTTRFIGREQEMAEVRRVKRAFSP